MFSVKPFINVVIALMAFIGSLSFAADMGVNANENDVALQGYDTVAYFTKGKPVSGSHKYTASYNNASYQFSSKHHRELFRENPEKYAPQFGGYCALGIVLEKKLQVNPSTWRIVDGKLYLNVNDSIQKKWATDIPGHIVSANKLWPYLKNIPENAL